MLVWKLCSRLGASIRTTWRGLSVVAALLAVLPMTSFIAQGMDQGEFLCSGCGVTRHMLLFVGVPTRTDSPEPGSRSSACPEAYDQAFPAAPLVVHQHSWIAIGCHSSGSMWMMFGAGSTTWFCELPKVAVVDAARACATKLRVAPVSERREAIFSYAITPSDESGPSGRFAAWREKWRREHPDWP